MHFVLRLHRYGLIQVTFLQGTTLQTWIWILFGDPYWILNHFEVRKLSSWKKFSLRSCFGSLTIHVWNCWIDLVTIILSSKHFNRNSFIFLFDVSFALESEVYSREFSNKEVVFSIKNSSNSYFWTSNSLKVWKFCVWTL